MPVKFAEEEEPSRKKKQDQKEEVVPKEITVETHRTGGKARTLSVKDGTTLRQLSEMVGWQSHWTLRVNSMPVAPDYILKDKDKVYAVPDAVVGGC